MDINAIETILPDDTLPTSQEIELWQGTNLKTFFALLSLATPPVSQAKVAKQLGITPVALSRIVNGNLSSFKADWIPVLSSLIKQINLDAVSDDLDAIKRVNNYYVTKESNQKLIQVLKNYLEWYGFHDFAEDTSFWGRHTGSLLLHDKAETKWFFRRVQAEDRDPFHAVSMMRSVSQYDRISFVCSDPQTFTYCYQLYFSYDNRIQDLCFSLLLISSEGERIEEEIKFSPSPN